MSNEINITTKQKNQIAGLFSTSREKKVLGGIQKIDFLNYFALTGVKSHAAVYARATISLINRTLEEDEEFAEAFSEAKEFYIGTLEKKSTEMAYEGTLEPIFHKGEQVGERRKYYPQMQEFLLKSLNPEKFNPIKKSESKNFTEEKKTMHFAVTGVKSEEDWERENNEMIDHNDIANHLLED